MRTACIAFILVFLVACATSPTGRSQFIVIGDEQMAAMGNQAFSQLVAEGDVSNSRSANSYVTCVANAITSQIRGPSQKWDVRVFDNEQPNAFALPGGNIGVNTGMLDVARNQDQLATVIAHEVAHVLSRHSAERVSQSYAAQAAFTVLDASTGGQRAQLMSLLGAGVQVGVLLPHSRTQEAESDIYGLELMARAGFDPRESVALWQNMKTAAGGRGAPEFLSTHPHPDSRIDGLRARMGPAMKLAQQARAAGNTPNCR